MDYKYIIWLKKITGKVLVYCKCNYKSVGSQIRQNMEGSKEGDSRRKQEEAGKVNLVMVQKEGCSYI